MLNLHFKKFKYLKTLFRYNLLSKIIPVQEFNLRLKIIPVQHVDEVLTLALAAPVEPIDWTEADELAAHHLAEGRLVERIGFSGGVVFGAHGVRLRRWNAGGERKVAWASGLYFPEKRGLNGRLRFARQGNPRPYLRSGSWN